MRQGVREALMQADQRDIAGEARAPPPPFVPTTFIGSPDTVVGQVKRCREEMGAAVLHNLAFQNPGAPFSCMRSSCSANRSLPRIREV